MVPVAPTGRLPAVSRFVLPAGVPVYAPLAVRLPPPVVPVTLTEITEKLPAPKLPAAGRRPAVGRLGLPPGVSVSARLAVRLPPPVVPVTLTEITEKLPAPKLPAAVRSSVTWTVLSATLP